MSGLGLSRAFYEDVVAPVLSGVPHAAALLGDGSEVLGFDDEVSTDHAFGPRLQVFVADPSAVDAVAGLLEGQLPAEFHGFPVEFPYVERYAGMPHHQVEVTTAERFFVERLGVDPDGGMTLADWLLTPTHRLATLTAGAVFADPSEELARRREALSWYPEDVWRYVLAAAWLRIGQEHAFVGRTGGRGDVVGSAVLAARLSRDVMRTAFLVERRWAPYSKWLGTAFAQLELAGRLLPSLRQALAAADWRAREAALVTAVSELAKATNALGLADVVDPEPGQFYTRDIRIVDAESFTVALTSVIRDVEVRRLLDRLGTRRDTGIGAIPGAIDQAVDSVDVLTSVGRCRSAAALLGLTPSQL